MQIFLLIGKWWLFLLQTIDIVMPLVRARNIDTFLLANNAHSTLIFLLFCCNFAKTFRTYLFFLALMVLNAHYFCFVAILQKLSKFVSFSLYMVTKCTSLT
jgi:hypothetical protein